jgi:Selenoprotein, putative
MKRLVAGWRWLQREWSADGQYRRYVDHQQRQHPGWPVLDRDEFFREEQRRKWQGIRRCC